MPYANNSGVKIHYEVVGEGIPLMAVHGFSGTLETWSQFGYAQELAKEYRLILVDIRGHGASDKPHDSSEYEFQILVGDLVSILDELKIDRTHYLGYSMGGRIGFRFSIFAPSRLSSLVLGGATYPLTGREDSEDLLLIQIQQGLEEGIREAPKNPMEFIVAAQEKSLGFSLPPSMKSLYLASDPWALLAAIRMFRNAISPKPEEVLPKIKMPCLLFVGEADPRFLTVKESASRIPGAKFISLPGLDHVQGFMRRDLALPPIREFLAEVNAH